MGLIRSIPACCLVVELSTCRLADAINCVNVWHGIHWSNCTWMVTMYWLMQTISIESLTPYHVNRPEQVWIAFFQPFSRRIEHDSEWKLFFFEFSVKFVMNISKEKSTQQMGIFLGNFWCRNGRSNSGICVMTHESLWILSNELFIWCLQSLLNRWDPNSLHSLW